MAQQKKKTPAMLPAANRGAIHPVKNVGTVTAAGGAAALIDWFMPAIGAQLGPLGLMLVPALTGLLNTAGSMARTQVAGGGHWIWRAVAWL